MSDAGYEPTRYDVPPVPGPGGVPPGGPGDGLPPDVPPPPDNRPWIIGGLVALIVVVVLALLLLGGDDDDDDVATDTSTSTTSSLPEVTTSSTSSTTSTTAAPATTVTTAAPATTAAPPTTSPPPPTLDPGDCADEGEDENDPDRAARQVFEAWRSGDQNCAAQLMTDDALADLFALDPSGTSPDDLQPCTEQDEPDPHFDCAVLNPSGATHLRMNFSPTDGWRVFQVEQTAD